MNEITAQVGEELAKDIASVREKNPDVWTSALDHDIDNILQASICALGLDIHMYNNNSLSYGRLELILSRQSKC